METNTTAVLRGTASEADTKSLTQTKRLTRKQILIIAGLVVVTLIASYVGYQSYFFVSTDNAMVQAPATLLSARVAGFISRVAVEENEKVKAGQVLVEIRPDDYKNLVDQYDYARASLVAELRGAEINYRRALSLFKNGASTQERLDAAETQLHALQNRLKSTEAQVATAKLNLEYTKIVAPTDGRVGKKSFELGMYASVGQPLLGFVEGKSRWVVANLKETEMANVRIGNPAEVEVDAIAGRTFIGQVESISPATGATFSLLPPDNATGNFTKVVQRVPVRIKLLNLQDGDIDLLQSGLSAEVKIRVR